MTPELNLDCLEAIFGFLTPLEWIDLSDVCHQWRLAVSRMWSQLAKSKITFGSFEDYIGKQGNPANSREIRKMALRLSPFIKSLSVWFTATSGDLDLYFFLGKNQRLVYKLKDRRENHEREFQLLIQNTTELTEVEFQNEYPSRESLDVIFSQNEIKKLSVDDMDLGTIQESYTDGIEELHLKINKGVERYGSFEKHFPNLQKVVYIKWIHADPRSNSSIGKLDLSRILSCVNSNLKQFSIVIRADIERIDFTSDEFKHFYRLSQLEELLITFSGYSIVINVEKFLEKLVVRLPQLRILQIRDVIFNNSAICSLMAFQQLESMLVKPDRKEFCETEFPEMKNLTECHVLLAELSYTTESYRKGVVKMISKMPKLQRLIFDDNRYLRDIDARLTIDVVYQVIVLATSQDKKVEIKVDWMYKKLRIEKKRMNEYQGFPYNEPEMLHIELKSRIGLPIIKTIFLNEMQRYVEENMKDHQMLVL